MSEHTCDTGHFDRTICPEPCGMMHSYCATCGKRADNCAHDPDPEPADQTRADYGDRCARCRVSVGQIAADMEALRAAVERVRALADVAEATTAASLCRMFTGEPFPATVPAAALRAALDGERP